MRTLEEAEPYLMVIAWFFRLGLLVLVSNSNFTVRCLGILSHLVWDQKLYSEHTVRYCAART